MNMRQLEVQPRKRLGNTILLQSGLSGVFYNVTIVKIYLPKVRIRWINELKEVSTRYIGENGEKGTEKLII